VVICDENLDADHDDDVQLRICSINSILGPVQLQGLVRRGPSIGAPCSEL
jgi:hypothetical protein